MKTHIVHLDRYDDLHSTKDKMNWGKAERILVVWPPRGPILDQKLDLVLLKRHGNALNVQLAFVARDKQVVVHAERLGVPVFRSIRKAQKRMWRHATERETPAFAHREASVRRAALQKQLAAKRRSHRSFPSWQKWSAGALGAVSFMLLLAVFIPRAEITVAPPTVRQDVELTVQASARNAAYNLAGALPAEAVTVVLEGRDSLTPGGTVGVPLERAGGSALFTNLTNQAVDIPAGTILRTLDEIEIRFLTTSGGQLEAQAGATLLLPVEAENPGAEGNLPADSFLIAEGDLGLLVSAAIPEALTGGSQQSSRGPVQREFDQLHEELLSSLRTGALDEIRAGLGEGDFLIEPSLAVVEILDEVFLPPQPQPASELSLTLQVEFQALVVPGEALTGMAGEILDANLAEGYSGIENSLTITHVTDPSVDDSGMASWEMRLQRASQPEFDLAQVVWLSVGRSRQAAGQNLIQRFALETSPAIRTTPGWWPLLPFLPFRISIVNPNLALSN